MNDSYPVTETIIDNDGVDAEAFARFYTTYTQLEAAVGTVPMEVNTDDGKLTVKIHDPAKMEPEGLERTDVKRYSPAKVFGIPPVVGDPDDE